jgi:hypothetical protein
MAAEFIGAVMWYWILIHLWHEPEHITVTLTIDNTECFFINFYLYFRVISLILTLQNGQMQNLEFLKSNLERIQLHVKCTIKPDVW